MKDKILENYNGLIVLTRPAQIGDRRIYGVLYNTQEELELQNKYKRDTLDYVSYMMGVERWVKNGGKVSDDGKTWFFPDGKQTGLNLGLKYVVQQLMKNTYEYERYEFDGPIEFDESQVDDVEPRLVLDKKVIDKYLNIQNKIVEND